MEIEVGVLKKDNGKRVGVLRIDEGFLLDGLTWEPVEFPMAEVNIFKNAAGNHTFIKHTSMGRAIIFLINQDREAPTT